MVMTQKTLKEQKKATIFVKEDNPARKFMTQAQAIEDSERLRSEYDKVERYKQQLKVEREDAVKKVDESKAEVAAPLPPVQESEIDPKTASIAKLENKIAKLKGPGSRMKKEKLRDEIERIKQG